MEYLYCGGRFDFDYLNEGYEQRAAEDFRAKLLGNVQKLLRNAGDVVLSDRLTYVGPFYFETDGMLDREIVETEKREIERCTLALFLLDDGTCPGTVGEMVYAASLHKELHVFYLQDRGETESTLASPCWYPMRLCQACASSRVELVPCADHREAKDRILAFVRERM